MTVTPDDPTSEVFVGIAPMDDVARYLGGVDHAVISGLGNQPEEVSYGQIAGERAPQPPDSQTFWEASSAGAGEQTITWDVRSGQWAVVVMAPDASAGLAVDATAGVASSVLAPIGVGLLVFGLLALGGAVTLLAPPPRRTVCTRSRWRQRWMIPAGGCG